VSTLRAALARHGQEQLLRFWEELDADAQARLAAEVEEIDLDLVDGLVGTLLEQAKPARRPVEAPDVVRPGAEDVRTGRECWGGEVAVVIVAGGQGRGSGSTAPRAATRSARSATGRSSRSTPRRWWRSAAGTGRRCRCT
jgi:hypothetical protein